MTSTDNTILLSFSLTICSPNLPPYSRVSPRVAQTRARKRATTLSIRFGKMANESLLLLGGSNCDQIGAKFWYILHHPSSIEKLVSLSLSISCPAAVRVGESGVKIPPRGLPRMWALGSARQILASRSIRPASRSTALMAIGW